ncbi:hypothetical protein CSAL01_03082 [Colletotrichum salicis]|uniref:Uncharacterized protein n=1 Tax=Colletotrichum salicis TaxID=1209931 RepID=A0A135UIM9_9PEZI|nr:hypothetical protein CSAL01_03082 [Colletotrichum salicis]
MTPLLLLPRSLVLVPSRPSQLAEHNLLHLAGTWVGPGKCHKRSPTSTACPGAFTIVPIHTPAAAAHRQLLAQPVARASHRIASHHIAGSPPSTSRQPPPSDSHHPPHPLSAINSSTQQATHIEHQRPVSRIQKARYLHTSGPSGPSPLSPGFQFQPSRRPASPPRAQGSRVSPPAAPFLHSSRVTANNSPRDRVHLTQKRPPTSCDQSRSGSRGALASPRRHCHPPCRSLSLPPPAAHCSAQRITNCHQTTLCPAVTFIFHSLLSRDANSRPDLSLPLESPPIDDKTSDQLIPIENATLFLYPPSPTIILVSPWQSRLLRILSLFLSVALVLRSVT